MGLLDNAARFLKARKDANLRQNEAASRLGINRVSLWCIEKGRYAPNLEIFVRMARVYDQSPNQLLGWQEENCG